MIRNRPGSEWFRNTVAGRMCLTGYHGIIGTGLWDERGLHSSPQIKRVRMDGRALMILIKLGWTRGQY